jgi:hypothetical protein
MKKFRKKPVIVEAVQWTGRNDQEINKFAAPHGVYKREVIIQTLEGVMRGQVGDWIIRGVKGEFYPCKPDIFAATYEPVD